MKKTLILSMISVINMAAFHCQAADIDAGKVKAAVCAACHGINGMAVNPMWPNLAGQNEIYLLNQIKAFRDGKRQDPSMSPMAAGLSDEDAANLAAYFASLK